ncbi:MAG: protein-glutamate O-methyltransferase CheR [Porticoccaceae bacterium]|nr:protein-glutamate O-methyltransferase CheR [Gammaproteobacteria bacterium]TAL09251.1 MAG: protein-glutamate O-methyltransferase CheR [Porticoccaceae bacterium]
MSRSSATDTAIAPEAYREFCDFLERASGIVLGDNKQYLVTSRLSRLMGEFGFMHFGDLLTALRSSGSQALGSRIVEAMTTNETSWFRDEHPFAVLRELIFPELAKSRRCRLRIWSAACASGQEPYSIAIVQQEYRRANPGALQEDAEILGTDISVSMLDLAKAGYYDQFAMSRGLTDEYKKRYFRPRDIGHKLVKELRNRVQFRQLNLLHSYAHLGRFDVIFCRNVLIYFALEDKNAILSRMAASLSPGGYLVLGGTESLTAASEVLERVRHGGGVVYRRRD